MWNNLVEKAMSLSWLTPVRVQRIAVCCALLSALFLVMDVLNHDKCGGLLDRHGEVLGRDFANYWSGAQLAAAKKTEIVYDIRAFHAFQEAHVAPEKELRWYAYSPVALLLSLPIAVFGYLPGLIFWQLAGGLVCGVILARLVGWRLAVPLVVAPPASYFNAVAGQNGAFTAALMAGGIMLLRRRPVIAGILFGAMCFKPQLALLIPVALAGGGYWRSLVTFVVTGIVLFAASVAFFGQKAWVAYTKIAPNNLAILQSVDLNWHRMPSVYVMARTFGMSSLTAFGVQGLSSLVVSAVVFVIWKKEISILIKGAALVIGTFLATPYAWDYDMVMITFATVFFFTGKETTSRFEKLAVVTAMLVPLLALIIANKTGLQLGPLAIGAAMWAIVAPLVPPVLRCDLRKGARMAPAKSASEM